MATAMSLSELAGLLTDEGDLAGAKQYYGRALATYEMISPEHPNTDRVRRNFARLLMAAGNAADALAFSKTALTGHEKFSEKIIAGPGTPLEPPPMPSPPLVAPMRRWRCATAMASNPIPDPRHEERATGGRPYWRAAAPVQNQSGVDTLPSNGPSSM
jgi:hypothetical protein